MLLVRFPSKFSFLPFQFLFHFFSATNGAVDPDPERLITGPNPAVIFFSKIFFSEYGKSFGYIWIWGISYNSSVKIKNLKESLSTNRKPTIF